MKKAKKRYPKHHKIHKRHHRVKLATLFFTKIVIAIVAFTIGLYLGTFTNSTFAALLIAFGLAILTYLFTVLHVIDYLEL